MLNHLPTESQARKAVPLCTGVLDYFPAALAEVARLSKVGNDKHNPNEPLHHARGKSMDHADCLLRHLIERGTLDTDGISHSVKVAWRALALLQEELEAHGAPLARAARLASWGMDDATLNRNAEFAPPVELGQCDRCRMIGRHASWCSAGNSGQMSFEGL